MIYHGCSKEAPRWPWVQKSEVWISVGEEPWQTGQPRQVWVSKGANCGHAYAIGTLAASPDMPKVLAKRAKGLGAARLSRSSANGRLQVLGLVRGNELIEGQTGEAVLLSCIECEVIPRRRQDSSGCNL